MAKKTKQATEIEIVQREAFVYDLLLSGARGVDIINSFREKYGGTHKQAETYITKARALIKEQAKAHRETAFDMHAARLELIITKTLAKEEYRITLEALRENAKLFGLYEGDKKLFDLEKIVIERQLITFNQNLQNISKDANNVENE